MDGIVWPFCLVGPLEEHIVGIHGRQLWWVGVWGFDIHRILVLNVVKLECEMYVERCRCVGILERRGLEENGKDRMNDWR